MGNVEAATVRGKGKRQEYDWKTIFISAANMSDKSKWSGSKGAWLHRTHSHTHSHTHMQASCKGTISKSIFMTAPADLLQLAMRVPNSPRSSWILFSIFHFCAFPIFFFFLLIAAVAFCRAHKIIICRVWFSYASAYLFIVSVYLCIASFMTLQHLMIYAF